MSITPGSRGPPSYIIESYFGKIGDRLGDRKASASHPCLLELDELGTEVGCSPFMTPVKSEEHGVLMVPSFAKSKPRQQFVNRLTLPPVS